MEIDIYNRAVCKRCGKMSGEHQAGEDLRCSHLSKRTFLWSGAVRDINGTLIGEEREPNTRFLINRLTTEAIRRNSNGL
jgi:hypothetical protein